MDEVSQPKKVLVLESDLRNMYYTIGQATKRTHQFMLVWVQNVAQAVDAFKFYEMDFDLVIVDDSSENPLCSSTTLISYLLAEGYKGQIYSTAAFPQNIRAHRELGCRFSISKIEILSSIIFAMSTIKEPLKPVKF